MNTAADEQSHKMSIRLKLANSRVCDHKNNNSSSTQSQKKELINLVKRQTLILNVKRTKLDSVVVSAMNFLNILTLLGIERVLPYLQKPSQVCIESEI